MERLRSVHLVKRRLNVLCSDSSEKNIYCTCNFFISIVHHMHHIRYSRINKCFCSLRSLLPRLVREHNNILLRFHYETYLDECNSDDVAMFVECIDRHNFCITYLYRNAYVREGIDLLMYV